MLVNGRWFGTVVGVSVALGVVACGDDESAEGSGGGGAGATSSATDAATSSSGSNGATTTSSSDASSTGSDVSSTGNGGAPSSSGSGSAGPCPDEPPNGGEPCQPTEPATCHYEDEVGCPDGAFIPATFDATCEEGTWNLDVERQAECCPEYLTQSGQVECSTDGLTCNYDGEVACSDGGFIGGVITATCDGQTWRTVYEPTGGVCDGEPACPAELPDEQSECDPAAFPDACIWETASPCPDGQGFDVITIATCTQYAGYGVWHFGTLFEGTECPACDDDLCAVDGLACVVSYEGCESAGTATSGTVCKGDGAMEVWLDSSGCQ